jgi:hypothetical protein
VTEAYPGSGSSESVEGGTRERGEPADAVFVLGGEVGSSRLVGELEKPVAAAVLAADCRGQPAPHRWMAVGHVTEAGKVRMGLDLFLRQTYYLTSPEPDAVQPETARVDAKVAPARVMLAQVEELARCMSVTVEVDTEGSLLSLGQGSR